MARNVLCIPMVKVTSTCYPKDGMIMHGVYNSPSRAAALTRGPGIPKGDFRLDFSNNLRAIWDC